MKVTIANMIDQLITTDIKIYFLENKKRDALLPDSEIANVTRITNDLNVRRNIIISEIDLALNDIAMGEQQQLFGSNKMYGK